MSAQIEAGDKGGHLIFDLIHSADDLAMQAPLTGIAPIVAVVITKSLNDKFAPVSGQFRRRTEKQVEEVAPTSGTLLDPELLRIRVTTLLGLGALFRTDSQNGHACQEKNHENPY
jgi:hypothetical protein